MKLLDLSLATAAANVACDEALLDFCERTGAEEILRFWESPQPFVVVGYANKIQTEVNVGACAEKNIPIFRRCSGGGTVIQGPGCLNYALILNIAENPLLQTITQTNRFVMERNRILLEEFLARPVKVEGHTDLTVDGLKFSGNAQRRKKNFCLFHGTFLLNFEIPLIETCLRFPSMQPDYRENRSHKRFVTNLNSEATALKKVFSQGWNVTGETKFLPLDHQLLLAKYESKEWIWKF
ncbi:MAG: lipoate--protein ligase family protein [Verrucomicrobiota bacterium]